MLLDAGAERNQLSDRWTPVYASWPPYGERGDKHLVFRDVEVWVDDGDRSR